MHWARTNDDRDQPCTVVHCPLMQGLSECRQVAGQVSAAVAYHLLSNMSQDQADTAACLAKLDLPLLQLRTSQAGDTKASSLCTVQQSPWPQLLQFYIYCSLSTMHKGSCYIPLLLDAIRRACEPQQCRITIKSLSRGIEVRKPS